MKFILLLFLVAQCSCMYYVSDSLGNDSNPGSLLFPVKSLTKLFDVMMQDTDSSGIILKGIYSGPLNSNISAISSTKRNLQISGQNCAIEVDSTFITLSNIHLQLRTVAFIHNKQSPDAIFNLGSSSIIFAQVNYTSNIQQQFAIISSSNSKISFVDSTISLAESDSLINVTSNSMLEIQGVVNFNSTYPTCDNCTINVMDALLIIDVSTVKEKNLQYNSTTILNSVFQINTKNKIYTNYINGTNVTITGSKQNQEFNINGAGSITQLSILNSKNVVIANTNPLQLTDCTFQGFTGPITNANIVGGTWSGSDNMLNGVVNVTNVVITNIKGTVVAHVIVPNWQTMLFVNTTFINNTGNIFGGIASHNNDNTQRITISNSTFINNTNIQFVQYAVEITIKGSQFINNNQVYFRSFYTTIPNRWILDECTFIGNGVKAESYTGWIGYFHVNNCEFTNINRPAISVGLPFNFDIEHSVFSNINSTALVSSQSDYYTTSVILNIKETLTKTLSTIKNCSFSNTTGAGVGGLFQQMSTAKKPYQFNKCSFGNGITTITSYTENNLFKLQQINASLNKVVPIGVKVIPRKYPAGMNQLVIAANLVDACAYKISNAFPIPDSYNISIVLFNQTYPAYQVSNIVETQVIQLDQPPTTAGKINATSIINEIRAPFPEYIIITATNSSASNTVAFISENNNYNINSTCQGELGFMLIQTRDKYNNTQTEKEDQFVIIVTDSKGSSLHTNYKLSYINSTLGLYKVQFSSSYFTNLTISVELYDAEFSTFKQISNGPFFINPTIPTQSIRTIQSSTTVVGNQNLVQVTIISSNYTVYNCSTFVQCTSINMINNVYNKLEQSFTPICLNSTTLQFDITTTTSGNYSLQTMLNNQLIGQSQTSFLPGNVITSNSNFATTLPTNTEEVSIKLSYNIEIVERDQYNNSCSCSPQNQPSGSITSPSNVTNIQFTCINGIYAASFTFSSLYQSNVTIKTANNVIYSKSFLVEKDICASGFFFANDSVGCIECNKGSWASGAEFRTECVKCSSCETTEFTGAASKDECICHADCFFNQNSNKCEKKVSDDITTTITVTAGATTTIIGVGSAIGVVAVASQSSTTASFHLNMRATKIIRLFQKSILVIQCGSLPVIIEQSLLSTISFFNLDAYLDMSSSDESSSNDNNNNSGNFSYILKSIVLISSFVSWLFCFILFKKGILLRFSFLKKIKTCNNSFLENVKIVCASISVTELLLKLSGFILFQFLLIPILSMLIRSLWIFDDNVFVNLVYLLFNLAFLLLLSEIYCYVVYCAIVAIEDWYKVTKKYLIFYSIGSYLIRKVKKDANEAHNEMVEFFDDDEDVNSIVGSKEIFKVVCGKTLYSQPYTCFDLDFVFFDIIFTLLITTFGYIPEYNGFKSCLLSVAIWIVYIVCYKIVYSPEYINENNLQRWHKLKWWTDLFTTEVCLLAFVIILMIFSDVVVIGISFLVFQVVILLNLLFGIGITCFETIKTTKKLC